MKTSRNEYTPPAKTPTISSQYTVEASGVPARCTASRIASLEKKPENGGKPAFAQAATSIVT